MPRTVLFIIHGMGDHDAGWSTGVIDALKVGYTALEGSDLASQPFEQRFDPVEITYDAELRALLKKWKDQGAAITSIDAAISPNEIAIVGKTLLSAGSGSFFWTHAADVLLYAGMSTVREWMKSLVAKQIVTKLQSVADQEGALPPWAVIGHSLGTIVAHDALHATWTTPGTGFEPKKYRAQLVMMVSNVSKLLQGRPPVLESTVMPGPAGSIVPGDTHAPPWMRGCTHYLNVRHALDPFTVPGRFDPILWPDRDAWDRGLYETIEITDIHALNTHGLEYYLAHPSAHVALFRKLIGRSAVTRAEENKALERYRQQGPFADGDIVRITQRLRGMTPGENEPWTVLRSLWDRFQDHLTRSLDDII